MNWGVLVAALLVLGCADEAPPPGGGAPGSGVGNGDSGGGGMGGSGGEGGGNGGSSGACNNAKDMQAIEDSSSAMRDLARDCAVTICISPMFEECVNNCVRNQVPDLSSECAACYAAAERCSFESNCTSRCSLNTCSTNCLDCMNEGDCISDLEACTGLPDQCS